MSAWALVLLIPFMAACAFLVVATALNMLRRWRASCALRRHREYLAASLGITRRRGESHADFDARLRLYVNRQLNCRAGARDDLERRIHEAIGKPVSVSEGGPGVVRIDGSSLSEKERDLARAVAADNVHLSIDVQVDP